MCSVITTSDCSSLCKVIIIFSSEDDWLSEEPSCVEVAASYNRNVNHQDESQPLRFSSRQHPRYERNRWQTSNPAYRTSDLRVCLYMFRQVIRPHELFGALRALKSFLAGVSPAVSLQLVGSSEFLTAEYPATNERPFSGVPPQMSSKVAGLAVDLVAASYVTDVLALPGHVSVPVKQPPTALPLINRQSRPCEKIASKSNFYLSPSPQLGHVQATLLLCCLLESVSAFAAAVVTWCWWVAGAGVLSVLLD